MNKSYELITVKEYLNVLDNESGLNAQDIETMVSIEKFLTEIAQNNKQNAINF